MVAGALKHFGRLFAVATALLGIGAIDAHGQPPPAPKRYVPGELIIGFKSEATAEQMAGDLRLRAGVGAVQRVGRRAIKIDVPALRNADPGDLERIGRELVGQRPEVEFAHPNWLIGNAPPPKGVSIRAAALPKKGATPNDPAFLALHWHYRPNGTGSGHNPGGIDLLGAWAVTRGDRRIVVAVVDTGILFDHPDFKDSKNVMPGYDFISDPSLSNDGDGRDADATDPGDGCPEAGRPNPTWHGSHVAGTIGAAGTNNARGMSSINWEVSILPVRVLGRCTGTILDIADGIRWAAGIVIPPTAGLPTPPVNARSAHVINLSLEAPGPCTLQDYGVMRQAIEEATAQGAVVVAAAGNGHGVDAAQISPASCPGVIAVAASDARGQLTGYSNVGARVNILAPGGATDRDDDGDQLPDGVWSAVKPDFAAGDFLREGIEPKQGTSMAAPHVSAVIALGMAKYPELQRNPQLVLQRLTMSARPLLAGQCPSPCGVGLLDAAKFVQP